MNTPMPWDDQAHDSGRLDGWTAWSQAVQGALALGASSGSALLLMDEDYSHWPLGEPGAVEALAQWVLGSGRHVTCTLLARDWQGVARQHPRWVRWRAPWAHRVVCRQVPEDELTSLQALRPTLVVQGRLGLQLLDTEHGVGQWTRRAATLSEWWQLGDAISQRSIDAMPITTLGL